MAELDQQELHREMTAWRHDLHAHPEFGFEEKRTAAFVAAKLREFGLEVAEGIGGTGVVGTLTRGSGNRAIALRADMDALRIAEQGTQAWRSQTPGTMHACGHDGHTSMLLGAAKLLAGEGGFDGTVRFIFQPAEEWGRGALAMLEDGLLERFPFEEIFGLHNLPGLPIGHFETRSGPVMSAEDNFEIVLKGLGGHAARPHAGQETLVAACALVVSLQTIVSRRLSPADIGVVSVTELIADGTRNTLPGTARILGDCRSFRAQVSAAIEKEMRRIAEGTAQAYNVAAEVTYTREFVPLINDTALVDEALAAARTALSDDAVRVAAEPMTASEDFARFLDHVPGCFVFMGNGGTAPLHNPAYDFNDEGLLHGARFHAAVVRRRLAVGSSGQVLGTVRDITEEKTRAEELAFAARHDALTGLLNRSAFDRLLAENIAMAERLPLAVFYVDLDYFKALNDYAGHAAGDLALKSVAAGILASLPASAHAARLGGDEFALLVPNCNDACAERLARAVLAAVRDADLGSAVTSRRLAASIGIAFVRDTKMSVADALACADDACYAAKAGGRDRFAVFSPETTSGAGGLNAARLAADLVDAMEDGRLKLFGQEIHRLGQPWQDSRHVEVLARLEARTGKMIPPGDFMPVAERFGLAARLDRWIIRTALTRHGEAMRAGAISLDFNLSAQTLSDPQLWDFVDEAIADSGAPPSAVGFEITETAAVTNFDAAAEFVRKARQRRCRVSLDDFGAGMSSFEYLRRFPIDAIKIDGSFVEHIADSRFDREIVSAITGIARSMGAAVVAEKVEEKNALEILMGMGVAYGQGYFLHRPEPLEAIVARAAGGTMSPERPHARLGIK